MNVEINFLEKKEKRKVAPFIVAFVSLFLVSLVVGAIFYQLHLLNDEISDNKNHFTQLEASISEYQVNTANQRNLIELQKAVDVLLEKSFPSVSLYQDILMLLDNESQLQYYQQNNQEQFMIETKFANFNLVTAFVSDLLALTYVTDVHLDGVNRIEKGYEANITVTMDEAVVKKELSTDE